MTGAVAAGHLDTARAAAELLAQGGNAFDATLAALAAACVAEPVLASLGGGGFLLARKSDGSELLYDFFAQTPRGHNPDGSEFYPIEGDFGGVVQEFHVGRGSIATPGVVRGLFAVHRELGRRPVTEILSPAAALARNGTPRNELQRYIERILAPILTSGEAIRELFPTSGDAYRNPALGDFFEALAREGEDLFYLGEPAQHLVRDCRDGGGHLTAEDLARYRVVRRQPLRHRHRGGILALNPPPSMGGPLIAFALRLLEEAGERAEPAGLVRAQRGANLARREALARGRELGLHLAQDDTLRRAMAALSDHPASRRGTTHVSVADGEGNLASLTVSNGEASGYVLPGTGVLLNNFLGEEDLHPEGLERWAPDRRMSSMMCPAVLELPDGRFVALGSGGSNRLRSAILQVVVGLLDHDRSLPRAVCAPRLHFERGHLDLEPGFSPRTLAELREVYPGCREWPEPNLYFGGVHAVEVDPATGRFAGVGDPRRAGVFLTVERGGRIRSAPPPGG